MFQAGYQYLNADLPEIRLESGGSARLSKRPIFSVQQRLPWVASWLGILCRPTWRESQFNIIGSYSGSHP